MSNHANVVIVTAEGEVSEGKIVADLRTLQSMVDGPIEAVYPGHSEFGDWHAYCNEDGKFRSLPFNRKATELAHYMGWPPGDVLCGLVVFLGSDDEGEEGDLPAVAASTAATLFDSWHA